ncbi:Serine/threonine protein phosphatase PrpC [Streptoalloteichus tenebrarius]|uniref:Serine/threonine protein phosphatase PrpC n=2 Tax=Streptoalloteichus tenebrarius (strain ATCC 17920 / DSM 40477 / JCM 4838 / CBS 697.72 / NBRC 16177 / NCIMB 11028 / NRRL B-12390 / A12253. 1 / ISP 5477) TaxID=1933 RepID=A0ABT1HVM9_STRSD|nr:Serine/threonine protein phosphatase PrpC [Streptoalloteichus tenebrarius]BFF01023.1 hypothetical protein GCM10020241_26980 [Streptoalloteichus tenebrarius]
MADNPAPVIGAASEKGPKRPLNADAYAHHVHNGRLAVAVVDGTGSTPEVARLARMAADFSATTAAMTAPARAIMDASRLTGEPPTLDPSTPTGSVVVAAAWPDIWYVAWAGDAAAYGWNDDEDGVWRLTTPHTHGQLLRDQGEPEETARRHDHQPYNSLAAAPFVGVSAVSTEAKWIVLASDGLRLEESAIEAFLKENVDNARLAAELLVKAGREKSNDDTTAVVVQHPTAGRR